MVTKCLNNPRIKVGDGASGAAEPAVGLCSCEGRGPQHSQESHQESLAQFMAIVNWKRKKLVVKLQTSPQNVWHEKFIRAAYVSF